RLVFAPVLNTKLHKLDSAGQQALQPSRAVDDRVERVEGHGTILFVVTLGLDPRVQGRAMGRVPWMLGSGAEHDDRRGGAAGAYTAASLIPKTPCRGRGWKARPCRAAPWGRP